MDSLTTTHYVTMGVALFTMLVTYLVYSYKKRFEGGFLTIEMNDRGALRGTEVAEVLAFETDEPNVILKSKSVFKYPITYRYKLLISNHSGHDVYLKRIEHRGSYLAFGKFPIIDTTTPIKVNETIKMEVEYTEYFESTPLERQQNQHKVAGLDELEILLTYQNNNRANFYTLYQFGTKTNSYSKRRPIFKS